MRKYILGIFSLLVFNTLVYGITPDDNQRAAMAKYDTDQKVKDKFESSGTRYCSGPANQVICDLNHTKAIKTGCVDQAFSTRIKGISHSSGTGYYPICQTYELDPVEKAILTGFCKCGCIDPDAEILAVFDGEQDWLAVGDLEVQRQLDPFKLAVIPRDFFTNENQKIEAHDFGTLVGKGVEKNLYSFVLETGRTLKVTSDHGVLLADGRVVSADQVESEDLFLDQYGEEVGIVDITSERLVMDPHNVSVNSHSMNPMDHLVVVEGVIIGDESFQNGLSAFRDRVNLRK